MEVSVEYSEKTMLCKIILSDLDVFERLRTHFSIPNEGKKFITGPRKRFIPDRIYFITPTGSCLFGMAPDILAWIQKNVHDRTVKYNFSEDFKRRFALDKFTEDDVQDDLKFKLRSYQKECVGLALKHGFGTFVLGTGAGKTLTISSILHNLFYHGKIKKAMILVPDNSLVTQFNDELVNQYGLKQKICLFYDKFNIIDKDADIIIANRPLFLARFAANEKFFREELDCLIVDEAHSIKRDNKVSKMLEKIRAKYRFGFTGTLAENIEDKYKNIGILGPIRYEKTSKELRDEGFLSSVMVNCLFLDYGKNVCTGLNYLGEKELLSTLDIRNDFIARLLCACKKNSLVMVNFLNHGFALEDTVKKVNEELGTKKDIYFIRGEIETDVRDEIKKLMEKNSNIVCIAITKIFSTGINIKNLHNIVLAAGGKSSVTVVQSIGRGLRLHPDKKELNIWDIADKGYKYSLNHAIRRKEIYDSEKIPVVSRTISI